MNIKIQENNRNGTAIKPEVNIIRERCAGCQECIIRCPTQALSMDVSRWVAAADNDLCVGCRQCERACPFSAISVDGPTIVADRSHFTPPNVTVGEGNVTEVRPGFSNLEEAVKEAERCLNCPDTTCAHGCPAHNDIPAFIKAIRDRDLGYPREILSRTSCMPDICSRVCDWAAQCEGACSWSLAGGEPVAIGKLERFVTDNTPDPPVVHRSERGKGLSMGVVGSGPAGIAAAWELASAGASVTIYERRPAPGGVLHWGIPSYILPDRVSERPIKALKEAGVKILLNTAITPEVMESLLKVHDAVIAANGAPVYERPNVPGIDLEGIYDTNIFLTKAKQALSDGTLLPELQGAHILVLGGGGTAIDVARSIIRLGGRPVIIHREEERFSPARPDEIIEAKHEGVEFRFATNIARFEGENGKLKRAVLVNTRQKKADSIPDMVKGSEQIMEANIVVLATGYKLDPQFSTIFGQLPVRQPLSNRLFPDRRWQASGIFAGNNLAGKLAWGREHGLRSSGLPRHEKLWLVGDALIGPSTVVGSMAQGRLAALEVLERQSIR